MKLVRNASSFAVTQYGVATFRYLKDQRKCVARPPEPDIGPHWLSGRGLGPGRSDAHGPGGSRYECAPFNIYLFPFEGPANEVRFLCEPGSLNFLAQHGFDFNKWIRDGTALASAFLRVGRSVGRPLTRWRRLFFLRRGTVRSTAPYRRVVHVKDAGGGCASSVGRVGHTPRNLVDRPPRRGPAVRS